MTTQQVFGGTFIVLLIAALGWACWCWGKAEVAMRRAQHERDELFEALFSMHSPLTLDAYQQLAMRTAKPQEDSDALNHALLGMGSEAGELMTHWKAHCYYGKTLDREYMLKELGDSLWFLQRAAGALGYTLQEVGRKNIAKLAARYPHAYSNKAALDRADERRVA